MRYANKIGYMNSKQKVQKTLAGKSTPCPANGPLAVHYCARIAGVSMRDYSLNPIIMADCILRYYERFHPDAVWVSADTWVTAQAMGARVECLDDQQPLSGTGEPCIKNARELDRIPSAKAGNQGRWPLMVEALSRVKSALGNEVFVVACFDQYPFSLACALMGIQTAMLKAVEDPRMLESVMEKALDYGVTYAGMLAAAGADMLSGGDSPAGLLGPRLYRQLALPFEQRLIGQLKAQVNIPVSLHICGNTMPILRDMATAKADVLELDHLVKISEALPIVGPGIAVWGNLDPVSVLAHGSPALVAEKVSQLLHAAHQAGHQRLVVSSGCTLAMETPPENVDALIQATHKEKTA
jgi:MtaA/CmuA family methyltransferase